MTTTLAHDRALAMRALMPRAFGGRSTSPAAMYAALTPSGRHQVDRVVELIGNVRAEIRE